VNKPGKERLFLSVSLPDHVKRHLVQLQSDLKKEGIPASWTPETNMHLTVKFLGETRTEIRDQLPRRIDAAASSISPFCLYTGGLGVFPTIKKPRVLWSKVKGETQTLQNLFDLLEAELKAVGFDREKKPFHPHVTIGRVKGQAAPQTMFELIDRFKSCESEEFHVKGIHLFKSDLHKKGAVHTLLHTAEFPSAFQEKEI